MRPKSAGEGHDDANQTGERSREKQLWCAVIGRALQDAVGELGPGASTNGQSRARDEARRWFADNSRDFREACDSAGLDPDAIRDRVLRMTGAHETHSLAPSESVRPDMMGL